MKCANCKHPVNEHGMAGCKRRCLCPFDYDGSNFNSKGYPVEGSAGYETVADKQVGGDHYKSSGLQPWDVIDAWGLDFYRGSALKYLYRAGKKGPALEDLEKARHYLDKLIELEKGKG